jgi:ATP-binding cassette subfamily B protein
MMGEVGVADGDQLDLRGAGHLLRRTSSMLRPYWRSLALASGLLIVWAASVLAGPLLVRYGIDVGIGAASGEPDGSALDRAVIAYVLVAAIAYVVFRAQVLILARVGESFLRDLRKRLFAHLQRLSMSFYDREQAGVVVSRMTSDIDSLQELVQIGLLMFVTNGLILVLSIVVLGVVSWQLMAVCLIALPAVIAASIKFQRDSNRAYLTVRDRIGATLSDLQEGISGVRVIQAFAREDLETDRFRRGSRGLYDAHMESVKIQAWYLPVIELAGVWTTAAVVAVGGILVGEDVVTIGTVTFFILTLANLFEPVQQLSQLFNLVQSAGAGLAKVYEVLDTTPDLPERPGAVDLPDGGALVLDDVAFAYAGGPNVLEGVSLTIGAGERLALVGPTGAGKSTLGKLIARLYDPVAGSVAFGGTDLRDATRSSLRHRVVMVPQEGHLFGGTVLENVRVGRVGASDREVEAALDRIGLLDRFSDLPDGLDTEVREAGSRLSAGERQLVSLARAALADPAVLVLDEATSNLDPGTESVVEEALNRLMTGRTVVVIAHRLTTAARADRVAVVDDGRLAELGTHAELMADGGGYARLYEAWMGSATSALAGDDDLQTANTWSRKGTSSRRSTGGLNR